MALPAGTYPMLVTSVCAQRGRSGAWLVVFLRPDQPVRPLRASVKLGAGPDPWDMSPTREQAVKRLLARCGLPTRGELRLLVDALVGLRVLVRVARTPIGPRQRIVCAE